MLKYPQPDLHTQATVYYLHCHLQTLADLPSISKNLSDHILTSISRMNCPMVDLAVSSMALAVYSQTQHYLPAATDAFVKYQELLQTMQATVTNLNVGNIDACLLAIFLMSRYEGVVYRPSSLDPKAPSVSLRSFSHHDGALAVLKTWNERLSNDHPATDIIKQTRRGLIRSALLRKLSVPDWMMKGSDFGEQGFDLGYDRVVVRVANVRHRVSMLIQQEVGEQTPSCQLFLMVDELDEELQDIDRALEEWTAQIPAHWHYQRHTLADSHLYPRKHFYSPIVYSYASPAFVACWNNYFATSMIIHSTRLRVLGLGRLGSVQPFHKQQSDCLTHINIMANNLASSIPFCLQMFQVMDNSDSLSIQCSITLTTKEEIKPHMASLLVWPLSITTCLGGVDAEQKSWLKSELRDIGCITGSGHLASIVDKPWLEL